MYTTQSHNHEGENILACKTSNLVSKRKCCLMVKCLFVFLLIPFCSVLNAQTPPDTTVFNHTIEGRGFLSTRTYETSITFITQVLYDRRISVEIIPVFMQDGSLLSERAISRHKLGYGLRPSDIHLTPDNYYELETTDIAPYWIDKDVVLSFKPLEIKMTSEIFEFLFIMSLHKGDQHETVRTTIAVNLPFVEKDQLEKEKEVLPEPEPLEEEEPDIDESYDIIDQQQAAILRSQQITEEVAPLLTFVNQLKLIYDQTNILRFDYDVKTIDNSQLQQYSFQADQIKTQFDLAFVTTTFTDPLAADRIQNVFSDYYNAVKNIVKSLSEKAAASVRATSESMAERPVPAEEEKSNILKYILIGLAVVALIVLIVFIVVLLQKKKMLNTQNRIMRKANMQLNKQKSQARQQKSKFKI